MKTKSTAVAYPTIPILFVAGVRDGTRIPAHNTMGMAITDKNKEVRTETTVKKSESGSDVFTLNGEEMEINDDMKKILDTFRDKAGKDVKLRIESNNYKIYSGSSDSGMAALVYALNDFLETDFSQDELADIAMYGSESSIRSVFGGLNEIVVEGRERPKGVLLASAEELNEIGILAITFDREGRYSAREIFRTNQNSTLWETRLEYAPHWEKEIKEAIEEENWDKFLKNAQENCQHAHNLFELSGKRMHNKEMTCARIDVDNVRLSGTPCYWTAGGGNVLNVFSYGDHVEEAKRKLKERGWDTVPYVVAPGPSIIESE